MAEVTVPTAPPLARVHGVELMHVGQWDALTGTAVFTPDDFAAAVGALDCPAVRRPILKFGHSGEHGAGDPALGYVANLATEDEGRTLVGDYAGMPGWLAATDDSGQSVLSSAYPDRSIEGQWNYRCQIGHLHPFVIHAVALLGVERPAIGTLQSLQDLYGVAATVPTTGEPVTVTICAAVAPASTGAMVALLPSEADAARLAVVNGEPVAELHVTLAYLGKAVDWDSTAQADVIAAVRQVAADTEPLQVDGFALSVFNPTSDERDTCIVLGLAGDGLDDVHTAVAGSLTGPVPEQHTPWTPHLTLVYTDDLTQVTELVDRTGPVTFNRIRVAFAGERTDIPLTPNTQAVASAGERSPMPSPRPTVVTAGVTTEDVRREYYEKAPYSVWIAEMQLEPTLQLIVTDDNDGSYSRVPISIDGDEITFGTPVPVAVTYVDKTADAVAASLPATPGQRLVFASRAESRPAQVGASDPAQPSNLPAAPVEPAPTPEPTTEPVPHLPAAEPEPITDPKEEDPVSDLSEIRSRLGLDETADEAAVLAALDARLQPADQNTNPPQPDSEPAVEPVKEPVAASTPKLPDGVTVVDKTVLAELRRNAELGAAAHERQRIADRDTAILAARDAGKIPPARVEHWTKAWEADPEGTKATLASLEPGLVVPVQASGYTGAGESDVADPNALTSAELDDWAAQLGLDPKELSHG